MSDPIRIPLSESNRLRLAELQKQKAQLDRDMKTVVDTVLGEQWAPGDPLWGAAIALDATAIIVTPRAPVFVDVMQHGAVGDGITDDTAAFKAALDHAKDDS